MWPILLSAVSDRPAGRLSVVAELTVVCCRVLLAEPVVEVLKDPTTVVHIQIPVCSFFFTHSSRIDIAQVDSVVSLSVTEAIAADRYKALPEEKIIAKHNDEEGFKRRWAFFQAVNDPDVSPARAVFSLTSFFLILLFVWREGGQLALSAGILGTC